jgi:Ca2+-transporting ATPase
MPNKVEHRIPFDGLMESAIPELQIRFGKNLPPRSNQSRVLALLLNVAKEPMVILLAVACVLYFVLQNVDEGLMMIAATAFVVGISVYQDLRSSNALKALKEYAQQKIKVVRDRKVKLISTTALVPGDIMVLEEGDKIPADGLVLQQNDFTVSEAVLTGEAFPLDKSPHEGNNLLFQGTTVNSGSAFACVTYTGANTTLQKLGKAVDEYSSSKTLLQIQVQRFVKRFTFFGITAFILICSVNYIESGSIVKSLLMGLTLALAAIPEEIPVAFSSFMALGAWRMSKLGIITRQPQTIENLGTVTVICLDKTGTITENKMKVNVVYDFTTDSLVTISENNVAAKTEVLYYGMLASEVAPFDAMEKAILDAYDLNAGEYERPKMVYEYPLTGQPPMMTHVYQWEERKLATAKGAVEKIIEICGLNKQEHDKIHRYVKEITSQGNRVLGVAIAFCETENLPASQEKFNWRFEGLLSFSDPPKQNVAAVFKQFYNAGIKIKLLTGDYPETAINIAEQVGIEGSSKYITGVQILQMSERDLEGIVGGINIFARMFPEAKTKVINALRRNGDIVAMTGDGVNDGPALKAADIGIAMGLKGTEIARQAADLILTDDNIDKIAEALRQGRKIFNNLKKAIRYIISIHIPIVTTAIIPLLLGWKYPAIFSPIHIIFLELIMGPTCSVFFEREPVEIYLMNQPPRKRTSSLFTRNELFISILQGSVITIGVLSLYFLFMDNHTLQETRTVVFTVLIASNIFLTFVNRSFTESFWKTIRYKNNLGPLVVIISLLFLTAIHTIPILRKLFELSVLPLWDIFLSLSVAFLSTMWFEVYKMFSRKHLKLRPEKEMCRSDSIVGAVTSKLTNIS